MKGLVVALLILVAAISTSVALDDGQFLSDVEAKRSLRDVNRNILMKELLFQMQSPDKKVTDCVYHIAEYGLGNSMVECKSFLEHAIGYCNKLLMSDVSERRQGEDQACREMLAAVKIERDKCRLNRGSNPNCGSAAFIMQAGDDEPPKKKPKLEGPTSSPNSKTTSPSPDSDPPNGTCDSWAPRKDMCNAKYLYGQTPGNSLELACLKDDLDKRSKTTTLPLQLFDVNIRNTAVSNKPPNGNPLVEVFTLPIGQGDCNVIKCNGGKNAIIFDCGSLGGNVLRKEEEFQTLMSSILTGATELQILISHADKDHKSLINTVRNSFSGNIEIIVGGKLSDYESSIKNANAKVVADKSKEMKEHDFCNNEDITFTFLQGNLESRNKNERGMLMKLSCKMCKSSLLFTADMEGPTAKDLAVSHKAFLSTSHYKMAHHGASTLANPKEWLEVIRPVEVHVSHRYDGRFHHPRCEAFNRLIAVGTVGMASGAPAAKPHDLACFGEIKEKYKGYDQCVYHRIFSTAPRENKICLIVLSFKAMEEATTEYYCREHNQ